LTGKRPLIPQNSGSGKQREKKGCSWNKKTDKRGNKFSNYQATEKRAQKSSTVWWDAEKKVKEAQLSKRTET